MSENTGSDDAGTAEVHSSAASLFDLRTVIALLFGVYGVLLVIIAIVNSTPDQLAKSAGIRLNLWSGIIMLVMAALFLAWVRLRPPATATAAQRPVSGPEQESGSAG